MFKSLLTIFLSCTLSLGYAASPQGFFFFGDSLSDSGYQNANPTLQALNKTPEWTSPNGHTWPYYFLQDYQQQHPGSNTALLPNNVDAIVFFHPMPTHINPVLDGNNFAAGGSTTGSTGILNTKMYKSPSLLDQVNYFVNAYVPRHSLAVAQQEYLIWSGSNDLLKKLMFTLWLDEKLHMLHLSTAAAALDLLDMKKLPAKFNHTENNIAENIATAVHTLQQAGAKKIVVILLPDVGVTPLIPQLAKSLQQHHSTITALQLSTEMSTITQQTNALIRAKLAHTDVTIIDVNDLLIPLTHEKTPLNFQETTAQFGKERPFRITNNTSPACGETQLAFTCIPTVPNAAHYVFEDLAHPTDQTHHIIGDYIYYQSQLSFGS